MNPSLAKPLPFAHAADIVRAHQKDEHFRGLLRRHICGALEEVFGHRRAGPWQVFAALLSDCIYVLATSVLCCRTLGEEYCELLVVKAGMQRASQGRRLLAASLAVLPMAALQWLVPSQRHGFAFNAGMGRELLTRFLTSVAAVAHPALQLHLAVFYVSGAFRCVSDRFTNLRAVSLSERPYRGFSYRPLGLLLIAQVLGQTCCRYMHCRWQREQPAQETALTRVTLSVLGEGASQCGRVLEGRSLGERCSSGLSRLPVCRICMCPSDCPTATPCGHLYCWDCIGSWCATKASCPLCRASVLPQQLLPLNHYETPPPRHRRDFRKKQGSLASVAQ